MPHECTQWPMNLLTRASGEEGRKLLVHPKAIVKREAIRLVGKTYVVDLKGLAVRKFPFKFYVEYKEQGHRHFLSRDNDYEIRMHSRRLNVDGEFTDIWPRLDGRVAKDFLPPTLTRGLVYDGELVWDGHPDSEIPTAIKSFPEKLRFRIFSRPVHNGTADLLGRSVHYYAQRQWLIEHVGAQRLTKRHGGRWEAHDPADLAMLLSRLLREARRLGVEGFVLKERANDGWWKLKGCDTVDAVVMGLKISDSDTRSGLATSVRIGVYDKGKLVPLGSACGFDETEMEDMTAHPKRYIGRVVSIQYQERTSKGKLKHGFFSQWRVDKNPHECTLEQLR